MNYYKYNNKLLPIEIVGVDTNAPLSSCKMKLIVNSDFKTDDIDIKNIISLESMYSHKPQISFLSQITEDEELENGDLVLFVDNSAKIIHNDDNVGWIDNMMEQFNCIGTIIEHGSDGYSYRILFNDETIWSILPPCILKISKDIKVL